MKRKGLLQVYTGDGKGKSTAAIGQAVRAAGHGLKVGVVCFFKDPRRFGDGEFEPLERLGIRVFFFARKHPHFYEGLSADEVREECLRGVEFVHGLFADGTWDMLVLDELNVGLRDGFLNESEVLELLQRKPEELELVLTGRGVPERVREKADLVSEVKKVKHPYDKGVLAREGIEY